jgi:hypothetical protein
MSGRMVPKWNRLASRAEQGDGLADVGGAADGAVHVKIGQKVYISAPVSAVQGVIRCWEYTLYWYGNHPVSGAVILVFVLLLALIFTKARRDSFLMRQEYYARIESSKQPQLPLPPPAEKNNENTR